MSIKDCIKLAKGLDPEDAAAVRAQQKELVASGIPGDEAWTQAAELVMESVLEERNALAAEIRGKGGHLNDLTIENLLNPASLKTETEAPAEYVYHATLTRHADKITKEGIRPLQTSNWRRRDQQEGERYNEDGGIFTFESPEAAVRWAHKMEYDLEEDVTIFKVRKTGKWESDPSAQFTSRDKSLKRQAAVKPSDIVGSMPVSDFGTPRELGMYGDEWITRSATLLEGMSDDGKIAEPKGEYHVGQRRDVALRDEIPGLKEIWRHLTEAERKKLNRASSQRLVDMWEKMPSAAEMASVAYAGRAKRGWYENSARAILDIFGVEDAPRFAALLAALSPQTSVEANLINATKIWAAWTSYGGIDRKRDRPTDPDIILQIMADNVPGKKGLDSVLEAWRNNSIRALTAEFPENLIISGPKVNSFMMNLRGEVNEVTLDTWMANYALLTEGRPFEGELNPKETDPGKGAGYLAMSATVRKAAKIISQRTGDNWTPAEVQETVWSWAKAAYEKHTAYDERRTVLQLIDDADLTHDEIANVPDFERLFVQEFYSQILGAPYADSIEEIRRAQASGTERYRRARATGPTTSPEGAGIAEDAFRTHLRQAAKRLDKLREVRRSQKVTNEQEEAADAESRVREDGPEYPVSTEPRKTEHTVREDESPQGDLFTAEGVQGEEARTQAADTFHVVYDAVEVGTIQSGVTKITTSAEAAHVFAHIRKLGQETFMVAITDDEGNIMNVIRHSVGGRDAASVYPMDVVGAIAATEGGTQFWLAHNHPSGVTEPSSPDQRITEVIKKATKGMPVKYRGHVIIGDQQFSDVELFESTRPIPAFPRRKKISITERKLKRKSNRDMVPLTGPVQVMSMVREMETDTGLILMDNRNRPVGVVALTTAEMKKLRDGVQVRRILAAIDKTNANAIIAFNKEEGGLAALENLGGFLGNLGQQTSVRTLDTIFVEDGQLGSSSERGMDIGVSSTGGFSIARGRPKIEQAGHRRKVSRWLKKPLRRLSGRVPVKIVNNENDVDFEIPPGTEGHKRDGVIYLFRDYIKSEKAAQEAVVHESIGHLGIEGVLGRKKFNELVGDVMNIMAEILMDSSGKLHPKVREIQAELRKHYIDAKGKYMLDARAEAREIIAHIAHSKPRLGRLREIYNKIVAWVRQWAANMGMGDPDMAMIETLLVEATDYITDPNMEVAEDTEKGAHMRRQPPDEEPSPQEREIYGKLGLGGAEGNELFKAISDLRMGWKDIVREGAARGYEGLFDGLIEIKRKEIEAGVGLGKEITYMTPNGIEKKAGDHANSAYVAARLATGISDMMTHLLHYGALQWSGGVVVGVENTRGFLDMMKDLGTDNLNDWLVWMGSHRADQLMRAGKEKNLTRAEIDEGMAIAGPAGSAKHALFTRIKNEYAALNKLQLDFAQEAGLINAEKRAEWESDWYVPFYRQSDEERVLGPNTKRGLSHQSAGIRRIKGAKVPTADLMQNILQNWIKMTDSSVKNHAIRTMVDNFKETNYISDETMKFRKALIPHTELHKFIKENRDFAKRLAEWLNLDPKTTAEGIWDAVSELDKEQVESLWQIVAPTDPDVIRVQRNGKNEYYRVHVPGLLRAVGHMQPQGSQSRGMKAARWFKQILTVGVTASPDFMMRNFIRDAAHSWAINKDNMFLLKDSLVGLRKSATASPIHRAMMAAGASFQGGYVHGTDPEATQRILRRELTKAGLSKASIEKWVGSIHFTNGHLERTAGQAWQWYREAGDRIENASRVATAEAGRKAGKPEAQWLFESKDLMDYSRRGNFQALIFLTDVMPFLNARVQGLDKLTRATAQDPGIVGKKILMIAAFSVFLTTLNDDDDDYKQLPDWEKDAYWHVFPPDANGKKQHVRIPKPFELGFVAGTMPERAWRAWVSKTQPSEKVIWAFNHGIRETLNINVYPQFLLPVAEVGANRHFYFDQPIESLADKNVIPKERRNSYTSETAVWFADTRVAEWLELSPKQLQHLWNGYTGRMGAYALSVADRVVGLDSRFPRPEEIQIGDVPLIKSIYKGDRKRTTQWQVDVYDRIQEVNQIYGTLQSYRTDPEKYRKYRDENIDKLKYRKALARAQKNFSVLRKHREAILVNDELTGAQKYEQSQAIQVQINALAKKYEEATRDGF